MEVIPVQNVFKYMLLTSFFKCEKKKKKKENN